MHALRAISGRCSLSARLGFSYYTNEQRARGRAREGDAREGGAIRATAATATSALAAAAAASRCKESCARERAMARSRGQTCYGRKKDLGGKERGREGRRPTSEERRRDRGMAQKRANVDKIGGGSLQLLAGMSGNAWDSILKARPRQSLPPLARLILSSTSTATPSEAPTLYRMTPGKRWDYLPIVRRSCYDHIACLIHETHVIYQEIVALRQT